jgi:hypothetical protein
MIGKILRFCSGVKPEGPLLSSLAARAILRWTLALMWLALLLWAFHFLKAY